MYTPFSLQIYFFFLKFRLFVAFQFFDSPYRHQTMSRIEPGCNLDSKGMEPQEFLNPATIPQIYIEILQRNIYRFYGCLQIPQASNSWFCATNGTERVLLGHTTQCKTNLVESDCRQPLKKNIENVEVIMEGCVIDSSSSAFYCQPNATTKINCTLQASPVSGSQNLTVIVTVIVLLIAVFILAAGVFYWFRNRRKKKADEEIFSPKTTNINATSNIYRDSNASLVNPPISLSNANPPSYNSPIYAVELGYSPSLPPIPTSSSLTPLGVSTSISSSVGESEFRHIVDRTRKSTEQTLNELEIQDSYAPETVQATQPSMQSIPFQLVPPRSTLSFETALPSLDSSRTSIMPRQSQDPSQEVFPRPYRTFVNIQDKAPDGPQKDGAVPFLHTSITSLPRQITISPPSDKIKTYPLDWKLPLTTNYETSYANELIKPKVHFSDYSIAHLVASFESFQNNIKEIIHASFAHSQQLNTPNLSLKVFNTVAGFPPNEALGTLPHERAFLSKVIQIILSDIFLPMTSPMKLPSHMEFLKKEMKEIKKDLKNNATTQLLFCAFDQILTVKPAVLLKHLHPLLAHASESITSLFHSHGIPPPDKKTLDNMLQVEMDWFIRLKREFPTVAFYVPIPNTLIERFIGIEGGIGLRVAFVTCLGLWDLLVGEPGFLAKVWCKE